MTLITSMESSMEHLIENIDPKQQVEQTLFVILADNSRENIASTDINNNTLLRDLNLPKAATVYDIVEDFGIEMAFEQINDFETVGDLLFFIHEKLN